MEESLLDGVRVLDLADERGMLCGQILGGFGADVIKIEPPEGDAARKKPPFYKDVTDSEKSLFWFHANLNKRGITLDIQSEQGREIFKRLARDSHFIIESFEPKYVDELGLGYEELQKINPSIIVTSITPWGQNGPYVGYKATDLICMAIGGMLYILGDSDRPPVRISEPQAFFLGSLHGAMGSMVAHYHRQRTGEGQHVDVSIQEAIVLSLMMTCEYWDISKVNYRGTGAMSLVPTPRGMFRSRRIYPTRDGYVYVFTLAGGFAGGVNTLKTFVEFANRDGMLLELKDYDWASFDPQVTDQEEADRVYRLIAEFCKTKTSSEFLDLALQKRILLAQAMDIKDIEESPQLAAREFWVDIKHPELKDTLRYPGAPLKMSQCPWQIYRRAPLIGEHNREVYEGELGLSEQEVALLKRQRVI